MTGWRARLERLRAFHADADSAESANRWDAASNGTNDTNGIGMERPCWVAVEARAAAYARWQAEAMEALAHPDPEFDAERGVMALHYADDP